MNGTILWANTHLLFWLSLVPFVTAWMGENHFGALPVALYGLALIMAAFAYYLLSIVLIRHHGKHSAMAMAYGKDFKGKISLAIYATAIAASYFNSWISLALYAAVAVIWFIPDRRIEKNVS